jgi:hypothetical protein
VRTVARTLIASTSWLVWPYMSCSRALSMLGMSVFSISSTGTSTACAGVVLRCPYLLSVAAKKLRVWMRK